MTPRAMLALYRKVIDRYGISTVEEEHQVYWRTTPARDMKLTPLFKSADRQACKEFIEIRAMSAVKRALKNG